MKFNIVLPSNETIVSLLFFSSIFTIPLKFYLGGWVFWIVSLVLFAAFFSINKKTFLAKDPILFLCAVFFLFILNVLLTHDVEGVTELFFSYLLISFLPFYFSFYVKDMQVFIEKMSLFSIISIFCLIVVTPEVGKGNFNYMVFGMALAICIFFILARMFLLDTDIKKVIALLFLVILSTFILTAFGNRGATLAVFLVGIFLFAISPNISRKSKMLITVFMFLSLATAFFFLLEILDFLIEFLAGYKLDSYSLVRFKALILDGIVEASSDRDTLYLTAINLIAERNGVPLGINYFKNIHIQPYPHNLFLEGVITFGLIGFGLILFMVSLSIFVASKNKPNINFKFIAAILFFSVIILSVSSTFLKSPILWLGIGLLVSNQYYLNLNFQFSKLKK